MLTGQSVTTYEKFADGDFWSNPYFNNFTYKIHKFFSERNKGYFFSNKLSKIFQKKSLFWGEHNFISLSVTQNYFFCFLHTAH